MTFNQILFTIRAQRCQERGRRESIRHLKEQRRTTKHVRFGSAACPTVSR
jgi:hypothetical protein